MSFIKPISRLCFQNIPETYNEEQLRQRIVLETKNHKDKTANKGPVVEVTGVKMLRDINKKSRRLAFVGFKTVEHATLAKHHWDKAYMDKCKVRVEYAANVGSDEIRPWSKHSKGSSSHIDTKKAKEEAAAQRLEYKKSKNLANSSMKKGDIVGAVENLSRTEGVDFNAVDNVKRQRINNALEMHPILFGLSPEQREKVLANPKFHDYIGLVVDKKSKDSKFWDNDDQSRETNSLRALYLASKEKTEATKGLGDDSYESLMAKMKEKKGKKTDDDSDDEEEYFNNPSLDDASENDPQSTEDNKEMQGVVDEILSAANNKSVSDSDYFKMMSSNFDSDDEELDEDDLEEAMEDEVVRKRKRDDEEEEEDNEDENAKKQKTDLDMNIDDSGNRVYKEYSESEAREIIMDSSMIFVRSLPYSCNEEELTEFFQEYGSLSQINVPVDMNKQCKGYAYVFYTLPEHAFHAYKKLQNIVFQGRVIHVLPGKRSDGFDPTNPFAGLGDDEMRKMSHKKKKELLKRAQAGSGHNWNSWFITDNTIADAVSAKFNIPKSKLLGANRFDDNDNLAVKMSVAETHIINETKAFLEEYGVNLDKFTSNPKLFTSKNNSKNVFICKNIPFETTDADLRKVFNKFGPIARLILPPYKTMAILEYSDPMVAQKAYYGVSGRKFKNVPLEVQWAPADCLKDINDVEGKGAIVHSIDSKKEQEDKLKKTADDSDDEEFDKTGDKPKKIVIEEENDKSASIFVKNIHFDTKEETLKEVFGKLAAESFKTYCSAMHAQGKDVPDIHNTWTVRAVVIAKRTVTEKSGQDKNKEIGEILSLGYGFIEFSHPNAAIGVVSLVQQQRGVAVDGHMLDIRVSNNNDNTSILNVDVNKKTILVQKGLLSVEKQQEQQQWALRSTKLMVRNVPFQTNRKEIYDLFHSFGQVKHVKLPVKPDRTIRGFAFVDFVTNQEAKNAFNALQNTHLYGRHLVLEWAKPDETLSELREKTKKQFSK